MWLNSFDLDSFKGTWREVNRNGTVSIGLFHRIWSRKDRLQIAGQSKNIFVKLVSRLIIMVNTSVIGHEQLAMSNWPSTISC